MHNPEVETAEFGRSLESGKKIATGMVTTLKTLRNVVSGQTLSIG